MKDLAALIVRMASENPGWGYTRIQRALKNLGHDVARSTVAKVLKDSGIPPAPDRPSSWRTFLRAHWGAIAGADFFTSEVWRPRGLVTYYTLFVIDLRSRRVHVAGSTPTPDGWFMAQTARRLTDAVDGFLAGHRVLICDRDRKWTDGFRRIVQGAGVRIVLTPVQAPNANAYAERFVRSIRAECLDRLILFGERRLLRAVERAKDTHLFTGGWACGAAPSRRPTGKLTHGHGKECSIGGTYITPMHTHALGQSCRPTPGVHDSGVLHRWSFPLVDRLPTHGTRRIRRNPRPLVPAHHIGGADRSDVGTQRPVQRAQGHRVHLRALDYLSGHDQHARRPVEHANAQGVVVGGASTPGTARPRRADRSCAAEAGSQSSCTRRAAGAGRGSRGRAGGGGIVAGSELKGQPGPPDGVLAKDSPQPNWTAATLSTPSS